MKYDGDIRRIRIVFQVILVIDLVLLGVTLYRRQWINAAAAAVWAINCRASLANLKVHQAMRDRETTAVIFRELEDLER